MTGNQPLSRFASLAQAAQFQSQIRGQALEPAEIWHMGP
jgi:hypothetical protein